MKSKISDQDVLNLLSSLKNTESNYPSDMIQSRRNMYIKQAAAMAVLANSGGNGALTSGSGQSTATPSITGSVFSVGKLLETALVIALVVEAGVATYIYRDKIADFINSILSPNVEVVASPPGGPSSDILASEEASTETPEGTVTVSVTDTPVPPATFLPAAGNNDTDNNNGAGGGDTQATSTPDPNDDPGLHLGQTKQPTQTPNQDQKKNNVDNNKGKND